MPVSRRKFLQLSALSTAAAFVPPFLKASAHGPVAASAQGRILILLQLTGGNDGLNTVIPIRNEIYYRSRPTLAIKAADALPLTDELALHPALTAFRKLYDDGRLSILNGVGYPNPHRSHQRSLQVWQTGSCAEDAPTIGWLGRCLDRQLAGDKNHPAAIELGDALSLSLKGNQHQAWAMPEYGGSHAGYCYPDSLLASRFKAIASLIRSGAGTRVYCLSQDGFDTHVNQRAQHGRLLAEMDGAITAFLADLQSSGRMDDVLIVTYSEFGRRVAQNAFNGTDHGTASNMFIIGNQLKTPGIYNPLPGLEELDEGDLKYSIDFRQVYATLLDKWLGADPKAVLGKAFGQLRFI